MSKSKSVRKSQLKVGNVVGNAVPWDADEWEMEGDFEITIRVRVNPEDGSMERGASEECEEAIAMLKEKLEVKVADCNWSEFGGITLIDVRSKRFAWKFNPCEIGQCEICEKKVVCVYRTALEDLNALGEIVQWNLCITCKADIISGESKESK